MYRLELTKGDTYTISISYLGYNPINYKFIATESTTKHFILQEADNQLDEVIIEMPVVVKQDTIIYNTDKFVNGTERKLKNVLKKLPGVQVDKNGGVTVMGKKITDLLVDGKKFFGGGTKLAVENIPANAIDKIQVLDNYNEVAFLKNISDSDKMAMNILLKEDKKNFIFGDVEAGKENNKYYRTHANMFYYSPKTNINFIGNLNNTGEKTFTFKDYLSFSGGINAVFQGNFNWQGGDFSQFLENNDILSSTNKFAALNITKAATNKLDISGYAIFSHTRTSSFNESIRQYVNILEQQENSTNSKNVFGIGKFNLEYNPNSSEQWYIRTQIKKTNNVNDNKIYSLINTIDNRIIADKDSDAVYVNQNLEWHKKLSKNHTFSFLADYTFDKNNPTTFWETTQPILQGLIPLFTPQSTYQLYQIKEIKQQNLNTTFKHFWVLNSNNHLYTTIGNEFKKSAFTTNDSQQLENGTSTDFSTAGFDNQVSYRHNDLFVGVHYKFRQGIFTFKQGAVAHYYNWSIDQQNSTTKSKWVVLPDFLAKIEFNKSKKLQFNYNLKTSFASVSKLANRFYLQSYNSIFKGNETLENELYHTAKMRYSRFSLYKGLMLLASVNYIKKVKGIRSAVELQGADQFLTFQMIDNPSENWVFRSTLHKRIKKIRYKFNGNINLSSYLQNVNNQIQTNKSNNYSYQFGIETLFDKFPTIELGYKKTIGNYTSSNTTSKFTTSEPFVNVDYDFLKGFVFSFEYTRYDYRNTTQNLNNIYELANATLSYKKEDSAWGYKITANNLFDTTFKQSNSFSNYLISDTKTYILPRVFMFSISYNL